jgi:hypothetical protein
MNNYSVKNLAASWWARMRALRESLSWWMVSLMLHGLLIVLAGLMSMVIEIEENDAPVIIISDFFQSDRFIMPVSTKKLRDIEGLTYCPLPETPLDPGGFITESQREEIGVRLSEAIEVQTHDDPSRLYSESGVCRTNVSGHNVEDLLIENESARDFPTPEVNPYFRAEGGMSGVQRRYCVHLYGCWCSRSKYRMTAVDAGLRWLAYHQEADGHWDTVKHGAAVKTDTAVTSMALLALLGAGQTERVGEYKENVKRAVAWLKSKQAADGSIYEVTDDPTAHRKIGYPNAIATLAMAEAAGMANIPDTKAAAQKAIEYCTELHQAGEGYERGGWRYGPKQDGDLSVSGWYIIAMRSAKIAGLRVTPAAFDGAIRFLDSVETRSPDSVSRYGYMVGNEKPESTHRLSAIGNVSRQMMGWKKDDLQSSVEAFVAKGGLPSYGANGASVDLYYWYYGTLCLLQQRDHDLMGRWVDALKKASIDKQCTTGLDAGSWAPVGNYCNEWGRAGQTALNLMCLEMYYRYEMLKK